MLLSRSDLLIKESDISNKESVFNTEPINENFSFLSFGLDCMRESNAAIRSLLVDLHTSTNYTTESVLTDEVMKEFSEKFSFNKIIDFIVSKFKEAMRKLTSKAKVYLLKLIAPNSTVKKYIRDLKSYKKSIKVDFDHYNYTYLDKDIPPANLNLRFIKEYEDLLDDLKDLAQNAEKTELIDKLNIYHQELNRAISDDYYNHLRGEIVGDTDEAVTKERFVGRLWSLFRNNETGAYSKKIEIPPYEIHDAVERFIDGRSLVKELERTKDTIEAASNKMQREINKISPLDFMSKYIPIDYDIEFATDRILKLKCGQLVEMCNIFTTAYSMKIDAVKEALIQDKKVVFLTIRDIMIYGNNEEEVDSDDK